MRIVQELQLEGDTPVLRADTEALLDLIGVTHPALAELKARGIVAPIGRDAWDVRSTVRGYCAHLRGVAAGRGGEDEVASLSAARTRLAEEMADAHALKNATRRGELLEAAAVERRWADLLRGLRDGLLALPARIAADRVLDGPATEALDRAIRDALEELGRADGR